MRTLLLLCIGVVVSIFFAGIVRAEPFPRIPARIQLVDISLVMPVSMGIPSFERRIGSADIRMGATNSVYPEVPRQRVRDTFLLGTEQVATATLDVPYVNQNTIPPLKTAQGAPIQQISQAACGCTSVAMILAYAKKMSSEPFGMVKTIHECFRATSLPQVGVLGPEYLVNYLKKTEFTGSGFIPFIGTDTFIFTVLVAALRQGTPQLLSVRAPSSSGHYLVVTGVEGDDPETAILTVNDPNGRWELCRRVGVGEDEKCYNDPTGDGKNVRYRFAEVTSDGGRLYVIRRK